MEETTKKKVRKAGAGVEDALEKALEVGSVKQGKAGAKGPRDKQLHDLALELEARDRALKDKDDKLLRVHADLENYKKRVTKEKAEFAQYANERLIKELLGVLDNLERAVLHSDNDDEASESFKGGLRLIVEQMGSMLAGFGLKGIKAVGQRFDPSIHEAISHEDTTEHEPETVIKEFQKGYILKDKLLRPAMVAVSRHSAAKEEDKEDVLPTE